MTITKEQWDLIAHKLNLICHNLNYEEASAAMLLILQSDLVNIEIDDEKHKNPCDYADENGVYHCPYNAQSGNDCRNYCGLGVDE